jgi:hypothetical protein
MRYGKHFGSETFRKISTWKNEQQIGGGLFFWRNAPERRSGTYLKEQNSKKAKIK